MIELIRKIALVLTIGIGLSGTAQGQSSYDLFGNARSDALGQGTTGTTSMVDAHANPAAPALGSGAAVLLYTRQSFGLPALRYGASMVLVPFAWGTLSTGASTFGFEDYRELHFTAGYARRFQLGTSRPLHLGGGARYHHVSIPRYGSTGALGIQVGGLIRVLRSLQFGFRVTNLNGAALVDGAPLPRTLAVGLSYRALRRLLVVADVFKDVRYPAAVRGGVEVRPVSVLALRAGVTTTPVQFAGGIGVRLSPVRADVAAVQHQELGWSPSASLQFRW